MNEIKKVEESPFLLPEVPNIGKENVLVELVSEFPEHQRMVEVIKESHPEIQRATSMFMKTQSQYMDNLMTVSHHTPIRNLRQILAQMQQTREAIKENTFKLQKKKIEAKMKIRELESETDDLKREMLELEILEIQSQQDTAKGYISGAVRTLTNYTELYNSIMDKYSLKGFTEEDFENEEEKYHITKAFDQAICAARPRGGIVDEGNMIYFTQIGINGAAAQKAINEYFAKEMEIMKDGSQEPNINLLFLFLEEMAEKFKGCTKLVTSFKGTKQSTDTALLKNGNDKLLTN